MSPSYAPRLVCFPVDTSNLEIILHISNYHHRLGGPWQVIKLGSNDVIIKETNFSIAVEVFLIGSFIVMALYHWGLYLLRRKDRSTLYFGLFCFLLAIRVAFTGEYTINFLFDLDWTTIILFEYLSFYSF